MNTPVIMKILNRLNTTGLPECEPLQVESNEVDSYDVHWSYLSCDYRMNKNNIVIKKVTDANNCITWRHINKMEKYVATRFNNTHYNMFINRQELMQ